MQFERGGFYLVGEDVGDASLGWLEALQLWGASVELFVSQGGNIKHLIEKLYPDVHVAPLARSVAVLPYRNWDGLAVGTVECEEDANTFKKLVEAWGPALVITADGHGSISRSKFHQWTDLVPYWDMITPPGIGVLTRSLVG